MDTKRVRRSAVTILLVASVVLAIMGLVLLGLVSGSSAEFGNTYRFILIINIIAALALLILIAGNLARLYRNYRKRSAGSRLKARLVAAFIALVIVPMAVVYSYSVQFLNSGIESWFDLQVEQGLDDALELSRVALDVRIRGNLNRTRRLAEELYGVGDADMYLYLSRLREDAVLCGTGTGRRRRLSGAHCGAIARELC
jgi:nitrogen fixation/metabolism regulation signal transduction histidine kinase